MTQQDRFCENCAAALAPDSRFCENCGKAVTAQPAPSAYPAPPPPSYSGPAQAPRQINRGLLFGLVAVAGLAAMLCCGAVAIYAIVNGMQLPFGLAQAPTATAELPTQEPPSPPTIAPSATTSVTMMETPMPSTTRYDFEGVSFDYDPSLAAAVEPQVVAAETDFIISPQHRLLVFLNYPHSEAMHKPAVAIYLTDDYLSADPDSGGEIANLQQMLLQRTRADLPSPLPFFTRWNAGQVMAAKVEYLDFKNGAGVRYLTQYAQDVYPINNDGLFYTFQGITKDRKWLISAVMPVSNEAIPDPESLVNEPGFYDNYGDYLESTVTLLDELPPSSFKPDLSLLDALFQSLEVR